MWTYEQTSGCMYSPDGGLKGRGYAGGNCGMNPEGVNNHEMQGCKKIGPLPVGIYTMSPMINHAHLGPYAIPLVPHHDNEMFGRSAFYIHGDTTISGNASEGCIIMPRNIRLVMAQSEDHIVQVIARVENGDLA